jgi:hypothetical protein
MEPLSLRAHHVNSAKLLSRTPKEQIIEEMKKFGYIENTSDSFVNIVYSNLQEYFQKLSNKINLTVGGLDVICENCIKGKIGLCDPNGQEDYNIFLSGNSFGESADIQILDKYGLKAEKIYTVGEIREAAKF